MVNFYVDFQRTDVGLYLKSENSTHSKWVLKNEGKFFGLVEFLPSVVTLPETAKIAVSACIVIFVYISPSMTIYEYIAQSCWVFS